MRICMSSALPLDAISADGVVEGFELDLEDVLTD